MSAQKATVVPVVSRAHALHLLREMSFSSSTAVPIIYVPEQPEFLFVWAILKLPIHLFRFVTVVPSQDHKKKKFRSLKPGKIWLRENLHGTKRSMYCKYVPGTW